MFYIAFFIFISAVIFYPIKIKISLQVEHGQEPLFSLFIFRYRLLTIVLTRETMFSQAPPVDAIKTVNISGLPVLTVIKEIVLNVKIGMGENVFLNSMCVGFLKSVFECLLRATIGEKTEKIRINVLPVYGNNVFFMNFYGIIELSIADVLSSVITLLGKTTVPSERGEK